MNIKSRIFVVLLLLFQFSVMCLVFYYFSVSKIIDNKIASIKIISEMHIGFPKEAYEFLDLAYDMNIKLFMIEPCIVWRLLSIRQQKKLISRKSVPETASSCRKTSTGHRIISFGIFQSDCHLLNNQLKSSLTSLNFKTLMYGDVNVGQGRISHLVSKKNQTVIHVTVFFDRGNFLFVHSLENSLFDLTLEDLRFGGTDAAFESFSLSYHSINGHRVLFPSNYMYFLFEIPHSQFLECRHDLAEKYNKEFTQDGKAALQLQETLYAIKNVTIQALLPIWMDGGSLLGWARHCGEVPYERDADFASYGHLHQNSYELTKEIVRAVKSPWYFIETFGLPWTSYEMRLYNIELGWQVDLFFTTQDEQEENSFYLGYHTFPGIYFSKLYFDKNIFQKVCSAEVYDRKIMVPCDYEHLLLAEYGEGWVRPNKTHFLKTSGSRAHRSWWTEDESFYTYQCLGRNQFNVREFNYSSYVYRPDIREKPTKLSEPFKNVFNEYKAVCTRLRWNRTNR